MDDLLGSLWQWLAGAPGRAKRGCSRLGCGCLLFVVLAAVVVAGLLFLLVDAAGADAMPAGCALYLLLDESNSMSDKGGLGSDPNGLRADAARLLISYLGVDSGDTTCTTPRDNAAPQTATGDSAHAAAIIHFGSTAHLSAPLTPLDAAGRQALLARLASPGLMGWTDQLAALALARQDMANAADGRRPAVLMLTDGKGEWDESLNPTTRDAYLSALDAEAQKLADEGVPLFIVLLANAATDADPDIAAIWKPLWQDMAARSPGGRFYEVRAAADLMPVYHDVAAALTGHVAAPPIVSLDDPRAVRTLIPVEAGLARLTLVIARSDPTATAQVLLPDGRQLTPALPGVRFVGGSGLGAEEIWVIDAPPPGEWTALLDGAGRITVWKDVLARPTVAPTATLLPTATPRPSPTGAPVATATTAAPIATRHAPAATRHAPAATRPAPATPVAAPAPPDTGRPMRFWFVGAALALGLAGLGLAGRRAARRPLVGGALRVLDAGGATAQLIDLDVLRRRRVVVGAPPADVVLDACRASGGRFTIAAGRLGDDGHEMVLHAAGATGVRVNGQTPAAEQALNDTDLIACGPVVLRYENLALRSPDWSAPRSDDQLSLAWNEGES